MVSGYNHNVKYQGLVFHVQTEDSGTQTPRVITHVFIGGIIIATIKTPYEEAVGRPDLKAYLTELMQTQHKGMLKSLIHGAYDNAVKQLSGFAAKLDGPAPINVASGQNTSSFGRQANKGASSAPPPRAAPAPAPVAQDAARPEFTTPPPPAAARSADVATATASIRPLPMPLAKPPPLPLPKAPVPIEEQGYAEAQLVEADDHAVDSLFGNLISEKTLDEVILSFLGHDKPDK